MSKFSARSLTVAKRRIRKGCETVGSNLAFVIEVLVEILRKDKLFESFM